MKKPPPAVIPGPISLAGHGMSGKGVAPKKPVPKKVTAARHAAAVKASKTRAANAKKSRTVKKAAKHTVRKLTIGGVACCSAEALAASLRLAGVPVSDEDVLALYWRTAADADAGASILATLEAAAKFGLAGLTGVGACRRLVLKPPLRRHFATWLMSVAPESGFSPAATCGGLPPAHGLILGITDPAPHAVLATPDGWWSWGELYEPWTDEIDEAWEVTW